MISTKVGSVQGSNPFKARKQRPMRYSISYRDGIMMDIVPGIDLVAELAMFDL